MMNRIILLLACLQLWAPAPASANASFAGSLSALKDVDDFLTQKEIDDGYDASTADEEEEEMPAVFQPGSYCADSAYPVYLWQAKAKKKKSRRGCACSSGCGMIKAGLKPIIKQFVAAAEAAGIPPASCIRTQTCQNRLRACYESCGQRGRAAKKSKHSDGRACDFSKRYGSRLSKLKKKTGLPIKRLVHGKEGGGLHEYQ